MPSGPLTRARLDLEEVLRRAGEAGSYYISFRAAEDGSCWFYSDEVNGSTRLAVELAGLTGEPA